MIRLNKGRGAACAIAAVMLTAGCATTAANGNSEAGIAKAGSPCWTPPRYECPDAKNCNQPVRTFLGEATEFKTQRTFFLDYPCDLKPGEKVAFVLNLHGAGSIGNWQRSYFPAVDQKEKLRLVVATPTALTGQPTGGRWMAEADDAYLQNITDLVIAQFGKENIKTFWLAGHSQGGATSRRIVCSDYFKDKVDGFLSLSGGRVGTPPRVAASIPPLVPPQAGAPPVQAATPPAPPTCDFSFIFAIGEREPSSAIATDVSEWATKYGCGPRVRKPDVVDAKAGYVTASDQSRGPSWGTYARPGTAEVFVFEGCRDGRMVADVIRKEKGHTEGLEPVITAEILKLMLSAKGGKISGG
jgi:hypothetical protein